MFGMHHSTVSYGVQEVDDFLSIGDKTVMEMCDKLRCLDVEMWGIAVNASHASADAEIRI